MSARPHAQAVKAALQAGALGAWVLVVPSWLGAVSVVGCMLVGAARQLRRARPVALAEPAEVPAAPLSVTASPELDAELDAKLDASLEADLEAVLDVEQWEVDVPSPLRPDGNAHEELPAAPEAALTAQHSEGSGLDALMRSQVEGLRVARSQLDGVCAQTGESAEQIVARAMKMDGILQALLKAVREGAAADDHEATSSKRTLTEYAHALSELRGYVDRRDEAAQQERARAEQLIEHARGAHLVLGEMRTLAAQTRVLAINAGVEAARQRGTLGVIAKEVRRVADEFNGAGASVERVLTSIVNALQEQVRAAERAAGVRAQSDSSRMTQLHTLLDENARTQQVRDARRAELLQRTMSDNGALAGELMELLAGVQFQDVVRQRLEHLNRSFSGHESQLESLRAELGTTGRLPSVVPVWDLAGTKAGYVMEAQREAHDAAIGGLFIEAVAAPEGDGIAKSDEPTPGEGSGPLIELF